MKSREEKAYYAYLEKIIREQKARSPFFSRGTESHEMDILMLMNHIQKKNPFLMEKIVENLIDTTGLKNASKSDILAFMSKTDKGTICRWKNEEGEEVYLVNNGRSLLSRNKRILVLGSHLNKGDMELFKKTMYGAILKKDIEHIYKKIERDNQRRALKKRKSLAEFFSERKEKVLEHTSGNFEKNFKELVREQGAACSPFATAQAMLTFMAGPEKARLSQSLAGMGIKDSDSLERLLTKWKNEALHPEYEIVRESHKISRERKVEVLHTR